MAHKNKVCRSVNLPGESTCLDIFVRPDGSFGFELYRRDSEDGRGWFAIGHFADRRFDSETDAAFAAGQEIPWLADCLKGPPDTR